MPETRETVTPETNLTATWRYDEGGCNFCHRRDGVWLVRSDRAAVSVRFCNDCLAALKRATRR